VEKTFWDVVSTETTCQHICTWPMNVNHDKGRASLYV